MCFRLMNLISILQVYSLIGLTFSSTFLKFGEESEFEDYNRFKSSSVHRGVFLTFSSAQKHEICEDVFSAQLYIGSVVEVRSLGEGAKKIVISDSSENIQLGIQPEYPILLQRTMESPWSDATPEWTLSFICMGKNFSKRAPTMKPFSWFHIHHAFHLKWLYAARRVVSMEPDFSLWNFITLSPDYIEQQQHELEEYYVNTHLKLMALREESPEYVNQIKHRVDLLNLTELQRFILCASILSSPVYRKEELEFSFDWMDTTSDTLRYVTIDLSLTSTLHPKDTFPADCIPCMAFKNGTDLNSEAETLYLTPTYDNQYSVIVLKEKDDKFYVDKYFRNIAILITLFEEMNYKEIISNFPRRKLTNWRKQN